MEELKTGYTVGPTYLKGITFYDKNGKPNHILLPKEKWILLYEGRDKKNGKGN